ncbi:MAG: GGDEF domain-containing protein [Candidatus Humimicrobiaceae bacterium]
MEANILIENFFKFAQRSEDLTLIVDREGKIYFINDLFLQLLQRKKPSLREIKDFILANSESKDTAFQISTLLEEPVKKTLRVELSLLVGQDKKNYEAKISSIKKDGNFLGNLVMFKNVTEYKKLIETLNDQSIKDFLTGIHNQRYFYYFLDKEIKRFDRYQKPLSLLMMDIDNFKALNDSYGHLKGDWLLRETAKVLKESIRDGIDCVARYGGDEFAVILVDADKEKSVEVINRILEKYNGLDALGTSLSIGLSQYSAGMAANTFIRIADNMMYEEKKMAKH